MMDGHPDTRQEVRGEVAKVIGVAAHEIHDHANLVQLGLKSLHLMQLINTWRRSGLRADFRSLAADPTIDSWWRILHGHVGDLNEIPIRSEAVMTHNLAEQAVAILEGGPSDIPAELRTVDACYPTEKIKLPHRGGYEHFQLAPDTTNVYRWIMRTKIAE